MHVQLSPDAQVYQWAIKSHVQTHNLFNRYPDGRLRVKVVLRVPDKRRRDIDDYPKVVLDSLTKAGFWKDDEQIDELTVLRGEIDQPEGSVIMTVDYMSDRA